MHVDHFVYGSVLPAYSPAGRGGYQFVCRSDGISDQDCAGFESLMTPMASEDPEVVRWQGSAMSDGRWVLLRSQFTPADADICGGRRTRIVHGLVAAESDCEAFLGLLPGIMGEFSFVRSPRECVERFGAANREVPRLSVADEAGAPPVVGWTGSMTVQWLRLAAGAGKMMARGESLILKGNQEEIREALRLAFWLLPPQLARVCQFDSLIDVDGVQPGQLWMGGSASRFPRGERFLKVDAAVPNSFDVEQADPGSLEKTPYGSWIRAYLEDSAAVPEGVLKHAATMKRAFLRLEGESGGAMGDELDEASMEALDRLAGPQVVERIKSRLGIVLGENIGGQLAEKLARGLTVQERILMAIGPDPGPKEIAGHVEDWLLDLQPSLKASDWPQLASLADRENRPGLLFLSAVWGRPADPERRGRALSEMDSATYQRVLKLCPGRVAPKEVLTPTHGALLVERLVDQEVDDEDLVAALLALRKAGYRGPIPVPAERIKAMKRSVVKSLVDVPGSGWRQDPEFSATVAARFEQLNREPSFFARLIPWPRKRSNMADDADQSQDP